MSQNPPLDHRTFTALPVQAFKYKHPLLDLPGGPVLPDPAYASLRHRRRDVVCDIFDEDAPFERWLSGDWIYVGPTYHHFGHIMAEMVHRIVPSKVLFPDVRGFLLVTTLEDDSGPGFEALHPSYQEVLEFCDVEPSQVRVLNENTVVERLSICEQGSNWHGHPAPWYLDVLQEFAGRRLDEIHGSRRSSARVYVSKSRVPHGGTILGERYLESLLEAEGFLIFHPQEEPLARQMDVYRKARELVFSEGSACHGTELLGRGMLGRTFVLMRRAEVSAVIAAILEPRSRECHLFVDSFFLGTVAANRETGVAHPEFGVSLLDLERCVAFFRDHGLARLADIDMVRYFEVAEQDLKDYFSYHLHFEPTIVDTWSIGEVRLEFERVRERFLGARAPLADLARAAG